MLIKGHHHQIILKASYFGRLAKKGYPNRNPPHIIKEENDMLICNFGRKSGGFRSEVFH